MIASKRLLAIMKELNRTGVVTIKELAEQFDASETTIRRDLERLEQEGKLIRVSGGAMRQHALDVLSSIDEPNMFAKLKQHQQAKEALCTYADQLVKEGECVFLDGGTTLLPLFRLLQHRRVRIVTHNQLIWQIMDMQPIAEITVLGGLYAPNYSMTTGLMTLENLRQYNFDHAFLGCAGVDFRSMAMYTTEMETAAVKLEAMALAAKTYLLADASKINRRGFYRCADLSALDAVLTDYNGPDLPKHAIHIPAATEAK